MLSLSPCERSCWITLLSYASVASEEGIIKYIDEDKLMRQSGVDPMREEWNETEGVLSKFAKLGMVLVDDNGVITITHWEERQRKPLTSYERVKRYRQKKRDDNEMITMITRQSRVEESRVDNNKPFSDKKGISPEDMKKLYDADGFPIEEPTFNTDTGEVEGLEEKQNQNKAWIRFTSYWKSQCIKHKGIDPEITLSKDKPAFHRIRRKYTDPQIADIIHFFLTGKKSDEHLSITACFSADTINQYKQRK